MSRRLGSRADFAQFLKSGQERIIRMVREANIKAE